MKFVSRLQWGARAPRSTVALQHVDTVVYHYTAADADEQANHGNCDNRVRGVQGYHMDHNGWNDIAYNFLVCKHGYVFEGRGYWNRSAATGLANGHTVAVCFLGDDTANRDDVTDEGRQALVDVTKEIQRRWRKRLAYKGHRDFMSTSCPGNELYAYVHSSRFAARISGERLPGPVPKPAEFFLWADWRRGGAQGPRPVPLAWVVRNANWCWRALAEFNRRHPPQ